MFLVFKFYFNHLPSLYAKYRKGGVLGGFSKSK